MNGSPMDQFECHMEKKREKESMHFFDKKRKNMSKGKASNIGAVLLIRIPKEHIVTKILLTTRCSDEKNRTELRV